MAEAEKLHARTDIGRALSPEEEFRLLSAADAMSSRRAPLVGVLLRFALSTGTRLGEMTSLTWRQLDLYEGLLTTGKAKTEAGSGKVVPMSNQVRAILSAYQDWFISKFGEPLPVFESIPRHR